MIFKKTTYKNNGNIAVIAFEDDGEMYGTLTVNIDILMPGFATLDTNNFPNAEEVAKSLGAVPTGQYLTSGFCRYPLYDFNSVELEELE